MGKKNSCLEDLKKEYKKLQKKHGLPEFSKLNEDFQIEKVAEVETEHLIREIRKFMADKFSNYLRFVEVILNPVNAPMFVFSFIKSISMDEKNKLIKIYKKLAKTEIRLIELDTDFSEKGEADFIKKNYELWKEIKKDILSVTEAVKRNWDNKFETNGKGYFG